MADSLHEIRIAAPPAKVYEAWTTEDGLKAWWTASVELATEVGETHILRFEQGTVELHFRLDELQESERVLWTGVPAERMPLEWVETFIDVRIDGLEDGRTRLRFAHRGWSSTEGSFASCNTTWGELMYRLRDLCEGKGRGPLFSG